MTQRGINGLKRPYVTLGISLIAGLLTATLVVLPVFAQNRYHPLTGTFRYTQDSSIIQAFQLLQGTSGESSLDAIMNHSTRVLFRDLRAIDKRLKDFHARELDHRGKQQSVPDFH